MKHPRKLFEIKILFAFALASLLAGSLLQRYLGRGSSTPNDDFYVYYFAAQIVHDNPHANLYADVIKGDLLAQDALIDSEIFSHAKSAGIGGIMRRLRRTASRMGLLDDPNSYCKSFARSK
jgi:hypothetical protein